MCGGYERNVLWMRPVNGTGGSTQYPRKGEIELKKYLIFLGKPFLLGLAVLAGVALGRMHAPRSTVHAQERFSGVTDCVTVVPKSWGEFKGGSDYGLAFQDKDGNLRFVLHPSCGSVNSPAEPPPAPIDLEIERK